MALSPRSIEIRRLLHEGLTVAQVAAQTGVTTRWVHYFARTHGIPTNAPPSPQQWDRMVRALQLFNYDFGAVAKMYGFSRKALESLYARAYPLSSETLRSGAGAQENTPCQTTTPPQENPT